MYALCYSGKCDLLNMEYALTIAGIFHKNLEIVNHKNAASHVSGEM